MTDVKQLQEQLASLETQMNAIKAEIATLSSPKVFKRGYAYKDRDGLEYLIFCTNNLYGHMLGLRIGSAGKISDKLYSFTKDGEYFPKPYYDCKEDKFVYEKENNLLHETERLFDAKMVEPGRITD